MVDGIILGVVSDTHGKRVPDKLLGDLADCNLIVHLGDVKGKASLDDLSPLAPLVVVGGNIESDTLAFYPRISLLHIFGWRILCTHTILSGKFGEPGTDKDLQLQMLKEFVTLFFPRCDVVLFGHTHKRFHVEAEGKIYVNPGAIKKPVDGASIAILCITRTNVQVIFRKEDEP